MEKQKQYIAIAAIVIIIAIIGGVVYLYSQPKTIPPVQPPVEPPVQPPGPTDYSSPQYVDPLFEAEMALFPGLNQTEEQTTTTEASK